MQLKGIYVWGFDECFIVFDFFNILTWLRMNGCGICSFIKKELAFVVTLQESNYVFFLWWGFCEGIYLEIMVYIIIHIMVAGL